MNKVVNNIKTVVNIRQSEVSNSVERVDSWTDYSRS